jgi:LacI family transcriptional regulator
MTAWDVRYARQFGEQLAGLPDPVYDRVEASIDVLATNPGLARGYDPSYEAAQLVDECLDAGYSFDGVVALGDRVALGVVNALKVRGVAVGRDVRVIGMDDSIYSRVSTPAISTVRRHTGELARQGGEALLALLGGGRVAQAHIVVPHEIVERATTLGE